MKKYYLLLLLLSFIVKFSLAQEIQGVTVKGITGITKSLSEVIALEKAHPLPPNFIATLRPELEGPEPSRQNPLAQPVRKAGSLISGAASLSASVSSSTSLPAFSNFLSIWGSYANVAGRESPYTPPDNCGDVGFTQVIATANTRMKVFPKPSVTGTPSVTPTGSSTTTLTADYNVDLNTFFANSARGITGISDPHVRFDRFTGRWFIVAIDVDHNTNNYCCVAVSDAGPTITASTNFTIYYFNVSQTGGSSRDFFDYPTLGVDKNYLYIGGNMFANSRNFSGCNMWVVNKANLIAGTLTVTGFPHSTNSTDIYTPQGVHNDDPAATQGYFIGASQTAYSKLVIKKVNYGTTPTLSVDFPLTTVTTYTPKTVPTLGGTTIDGGDRRLYAAMVKKNKITGTSSLWIAQGTRITTAGVGSSTGDRDGAYWAEIGTLTANPSILQSAMLYDGVHSTSTAEYYTYPTIALSGQGHNLMGFTSAGPAKYCQAASATRFRTDAPATFNLPGDFTTTSSTYNPGASRWGDYTQTVVDPEDDMTLWTFSEYAPTTNAWGVRAAQFKAPPPAAPSIDGSTPPVCGTWHVIINGASTNNSEFFEPGPDYAKHLRISFSGGTSGIPDAIVTSVTPTQIKADITLNGTAAGTYTVTVTNPDGQSVSTTFTLSTSCATFKTTNLITSTTSGKPTISSPVVNSSAETDKVFVDNNSVITLKNSFAKTTIYPNPVHNVLNLINANGSNSIIQILDGKGHLLQQVRSASVNSRLNVSNLASGMYMVKIISGNKVEVQKFIKN